MSTVCFPFNVSVFRMGEATLINLASTCPSPGHLKLVLMVVPGLVPKGSCLEALPSPWSASACLWRLFRLIQSNAQQVGSMGRWALLDITLHSLGIRMPRLVEEVKVGLSCDWVPRICSWKHLSCPKVLVTSIGQ